MQDQGMTQAFMGNLLQIIANIYESTQIASAELGSNEGDAGAQNIWYVLYPDRIVCVGDGFGMVPKMAPSDEKRLNEAIELSEKGKQFLKIDEIVPPGSWSRKSFQWMMRCIALSPKTKPMRGVKGMKGIGAFAYLMYGDSAIITSRPTMELAEAYWGVGTDFATENPTFEYIPPYRIYDGDDFGLVTKFSSDFSTKSLQDPWGHELEHGTSIEIKLRPGESEVNKAISLANFFRTQFGGNIRQGQYQLTIVDRTGKGEKTYPVQPAEYKGEELIKETLEYNGVKFQLLVTYDIRAKYPIVIKLDETDKDPLTIRRRFQRSPWNMPELSGFVDFPLIPNLDKMWNSQKSHPVDHKDTEGWETEILGKTQQLNDKIAEIRKKVKDRSLGELAQAAGEAATRALASVDTFKDMVVVGPELKQRKSKAKTDKKPQPHKVRPEVKVTVVDEHQRGVAGVQLELLVRSSRRQVGAKLTGISGSVSFGTISNGLYIVRMTLPEGTELHPSSYLESNFGIGDDNKGKRILFQIVTGQPAPPATKFPSRIELRFTPLDDPDLPYKQWLDTGVVLINSSHPDLSDAFDRRDYQAVRVFLAQYLSAALTEFAQKGSPQWLFLQQTKLHNKLFTELGDIVGIMQKAHRK